MRTGLDPEKIRERAVETLYQEWRHSEIAALVGHGVELHLQESVLRTPYHHHFRKHLARDFILHTEANYPRISVEFADGDYLWASIQVETSPGVRNLWQGQARLINNGYLIGIWLAGLLLLAGQGIWIASTVSIGFSLLWASHWNPLGIPAMLWERLRTGTLMVRTALGAGEWNRDAFVFCLAVGALVVFLSHRVLQKRLRRFFSEKWRFRMLLLSLAVEPFFVWIAFSFYEWSDQESWWLMYLVSWIGRFFCVPLLVHHFAIEKRFPRWQLPAKLDERPLRIFPLALLLPTAFYFGMGWDWLVVLGSSQEAPVLLGFKVFATAFLVALVLGSRFFSLAMGLLIFPLMLGIKTSALDVGFLLGIYLDGLLVGWVIGPWMMASEPWRLLVDRRVMWLLVLTTVLIGIMLSSVGIPYAVPWILLIMVVWGFYNLGKVEDSFPAVRS